MLSYEFSESGNYLDRICFNTGSGIAIHQQHTCLRWRSQISAGDRVPEFNVFRGFKDPVGSRELFAGGPTLVHFYVFDFSGSPEGG